MKKIISITILSFLIFLTYNLKQSHKEIYTNTFNNQMEEANYETFNLNVNYVELDELKKRKLPMIIAFGTSNCLICKEMKPTFEELHEKYKGQVIIKFINLTGNIEGKGDFPFTLSPVQFFYNSSGKSIKFNNNDSAIEYIEKENNIHTRHDGFITKNDLEQLIIEMIEKEEVK